MGCRVLSALLGLFSCFWAWLLGLRSGFWRVFWIGVCQLQCEGGRSLSGLPHLQEDHILLNSTANLERNFQDESNM